MTHLTESNLYYFNYINCRNISTSEDEVAGRKIYVGQAPASSVLDLEDDENVREYLVDAEGKKRRSPTLVHKAIRETLKNNSDDFSILNGGMVIVARSAELDDKARVLHLENPSIINGSQTQGELRRYFKENEGNISSIPNIKFEIIITKDENLVAEISISRNFQNDVRAISIAGRRGQLDGLEQAVKTGFPDAKLRKAETDLTNEGNFLDTEKLIQVIMALLPEPMMKELEASVDPTNKVFAYSQKTRCLKLFQRTVDNGPSSVYRCCLDLAPIAWKLYNEWKSHQGFRGTRLRSITRNGSEIVDVPDGIIFPIIAAHAAFVFKNDDGHWHISKPEMLTDKEMIESATHVYSNIADSNPQTMGKKQACYSTLYRITSIYARLARNSHAG